MNIKHIVQIGLIASFALNASTLSAMNEDKGNFVCKKTSNDNNYVVIGYENNGCFVDKKNNKEVYLEGYEPAKIDVIGISDNGQFVAIIQTKNLLFILPRFIAKLTLWDAQTGSKKYEVEYVKDAYYSSHGDARGVTYDLIPAEDIFANIKRLYPDNSGCSVLEAYTRFSIVYDLSSGEDYTTELYGDTHFCTYPPIKIRGYSNPSKPISVVFDNYEDTKTIKIHKKLSNSYINYLVYQINGSEVKRCEPPEDSWLLPNNHLVVTYTGTTDVITFDPAKGTMKGFVLPFAITSKYGIIFSKTKAIITDGYENKYTLYYDKKDKNIGQNNLLAFAKKGKFCDIIVE